MTMRKSTKTIAIMMMMIDMLALIAAAAPLTAVEAQTAAAAAAAAPSTTRTTTTTIGNNTTGTASSGIELSQQPVLQERTRAVSETPIDYAHMSLTYSGNGTLTLPINNIATIANFTSNGSALVSFLTQSAQGTEI